MAFLALISVAALLVALFCALFAPDTAHATYVDTREPEESALNYPENGGNFETNGDVLAVSEIPDGVYEVKAVTNSRMCRFYSSKSGADSGGGESSNPYAERAILVVDGGVGTAVFYVTSAYTRLYMGSAESAASEGAAVDLEGMTDSESYMRSDPESDRVYTMVVPALNSPIAFASFNGGRNGVEGGTWMSRQVIFQTSPEILEAIEDAQNPETDDSEEDSEEDSEDPGSEEGEDEPVDQTEDAGDYSLPPEVPESEDDPEDPESPKEPDSRGGEETGGGTDQGDSAGDANPPAQVDEETVEPEEAVEESTEAVSDSSEPSKKRGVLIYPSELELPEGTVGAESQEVELEEQESGLSPATVALIALIAAACGGAAYRTLSFGIGRRKDPDLQERKRGA